MPSALPRQLSLGWNCMPSQLQGNVHSLTAAVRQQTAAQAGGAQAAKQVQQVSMASGACIRAGAGGSRTGRMAGAGSRQAAGRRRCWALLCHTGVCRLQPGLLTASRLQQPAACSRGTKSRSVSFAAVETVMAATDRVRCGHSLQVLVLLQPNGQ